MSTNNPTNIIIRVWCSPRADTNYPWKWAVGNEHETMEYGAEETEADAKREAAEARASWINALHPPKLESDMCRKANPMTLPSASSLTDEQLRVLAAEADGWRNVKRHGNSLFIKGFNPRFPNGDLEEIPSPLHDANAAKGLLEKDHWQSNWDTSTATIAIFRPGKTYIGEAPDFCRAIVLSFLRAEGKIL